MTLPDSVISLTSSGKKRRNVNTRKFLLLNMQVIYFSNIRKMSMFGPPTFLRDGVEDVELILVV